MSHEQSQADVRTHSPDGVDLTLIRWMLRLSPTERLEVLQQQVTALAELRRGMSESRREPRLRSRSA